MTRHHSCAWILVLAACVAAPVAAAAQAAQAVQTDANKAAIQERLNRIRGNLLSQAQRPDENIRELKDILTVEPDLVEAHLLLGIAYRSIGTPELIGEAVAEFRQTIALDPKNLPARFYLAHLYLSLARPARAREEMTALLEQVPGNPQFLSVLGETERQMKNPTRSVELNREALKVNPSLTEARYYLGLALFDLGQRDEAIAELEQVVKSRPPVSDAYLSLGTLYLQASRFDEAIEVLSQGTHVDPARAELRIRLATGFRSKGALAKADEQLTIAMPGATSSQNSPLAEHVSLELDFYMEQGLLRLRQGRLDAAGEAFRKVLAIDSTYEPAIKGLAEIKVRPRPKKPAAKE